jgi:hypothetical protein
MLKKRAPMKIERQRVGERLVVLRPERFRAKSAKRPLEARASRCTKCDSSFVEHEPAFVHCRYCGNLMRVLGGSLLDQELYELRSGLRIAS